MMIIDNKIVGLESPDEDLTPRERVDRLVETFGWSRRDAWNFIEELIDDDN